MNSEYNEIVLNKYFMLFKNIREFGFIIGNKRTLTIDIWWNSEDYHFNIELVKEPKSYR